jgi:lipoate-protein ligase A
MTSGAPAAGILEVYRNGNGPPAHDLAFEELMLERAAAGVCCASLYSWPGPVVVLGYAQEPDDVDLDWCRANAIPVLRRISGGTGVVHLRDLALSLALPASHSWAREIVSLYGRFLAVLEPALRAAGVDVRRIEAAPRSSRVRSPICFEDQLSETLLRGEHKVVGCAQARRKHAVLIHAAILLGLDASLYARVFRVPEERVLEGLAAAVPGGDWSEVGRTVIDHLAAALGLEARLEERPALPDRLLERYLEPRWAPVPGP